MNKRTENINSSNDNIDEYVLAYEGNIIEDNNVINSSNIITPTPGCSYAAMARKPKPPPETVKINIGDIRLDVKFEHWHMIKYLGLNKFYCMICQFRNEREITGDHCKSEIHMQNLQKCIVVDVGKDFFIREAHQGLYHCGHCNNMQRKTDLETHFQKYYLKSTKNDLSTNIENTFSEKDNEVSTKLNKNLDLDSLKILSIGNHDAVSNTTKEVEKTESLNKSIDSVKLLSTKYSIYGNKQVKKGKCLNKTITNEKALDKKISQKETIRTVELKNKNVARNIDVSRNKHKMNISCNKKTQQTTSLEIENSNENITQNIKESPITIAQKDSETMHKALNIEKSNASILDNSINSLEETKEIKSVDDRNYCHKIDISAESSKICLSQPTKNTISHNKPDEGSLDLDEVHTSISYKGKQHKADSTDQNAKMNVSLKNDLTSFKSHKTFDKNVETKELTIKKIQKEYERIHKSLGSRKSEISILDNSINTIEESQDIQRYYVKNNCQKIENNQCAGSSKTYLSHDSNKNSPTKQIGDVVSQSKTREKKLNLTKSRTLESQSVNYSETQILNTFKNSKGKKNQNTDILCNKTIKKTLPHNTLDEVALDLEKEDNPISHKDIKGMQSRADSTDKITNINDSIRNSVTSFRSNKTLDDVLSIIETERNNADLESNINILTKALTQAKIKYVKKIESKIPKKSKIRLNTSGNLDKSSSENSEDDEVLSASEVDGINAHLDKVKYNLHDGLMMFKKRINELKNSKSKFFVKIYKTNTEADKTEPPLEDSLNRRNETVQETNIFVDNTSQKKDFVSSGIENTNLEVDDVEVDDKSRVRETNDRNTFFEEIHKTVLESLIQIKMKLMSPRNDYGNTKQTSKLNLSMLKEKVIINHDEEVKEVEKVRKKKKSKNIPLKYQKLRIGDLNIHISNNTNNEKSKNNVLTNQTKAGDKMFDETATKGSYTIINDKYYIDNLIEFSQIEQYNVYFVYFVSQMPVEVNEFNHKLIITYMSLNTIRETRISFMCAACAMILKDIELIKHLLDNEHLEKVKLYPFTAAYSFNLIRQIGRYFHCAICNILMSPKLILLHNYSPEHQSLLQKAVVVDNAEAQNTDNSDRPVASTSQDKNSVSSIETSREKAKEILNTNIMLTKNTLSKTRNDSAAKNTSSETMFNYFKSTEHIQDTNQKSSEDDNDFHVYIIANLCDVYIKLKIEAWNTLVVTIDNDLFCFVCDEFAFFQRKLSEKLSSGRKFYYLKLKEHTDSNDHLEQLNRYKVLSNFNTNMIRQRLENCHCAICNLVCSKDAVITHLQSQTHIENHKNSIFLDKKLLDNTLNEYHEVEVLTQKMKLNDGSRGKEDVMASTSVQSTKDIDSDDDEYKSDSGEVVFRVVIPDNNWHGIVSIPNGYRCILCNVNIKKKQYERHIYHEKHDNHVDNRTFAEYRDDLIHQMDERRMHCVLCNIELAPLDVATHIQGKKHKENKKTILNK